MGKRPQDLDLSDEPLRPGRPHDLFAIARACTADSRRAPAGDKTVLALYRAPDYLRWGVETLSEQATGGAMEPAALALLEEGLATIRGFPGVAKIAAAR